MQGTGEWTSLGEIGSDRDLLAGEKLQVSLLDSQTAKVIESFEFTPGPGDLSRYRWTCALATHLNATATHLRAGARQADGSFKPEFSTYLNKYWTQNGASRALISTACVISHWADKGVIRSIGPLPSGSTFTCRLFSAGDSLQTIVCSVPDDQGGRYQWPAYLSRFINAQGGLLRAGEKDPVSNTFVVLGSSYRNHFWASQGYRLQVDYQVAVASQSRDDARMIYDALCTQTAVAAPSAEVINGWLQGFAGGRFHDLNYPSPGTAVSDISSLTSHLVRTVQIASYLYKQAEPSPAAFLSCATEALNFYAAQDYQIVSWWERQIGLAKRATVAALLLARHLPVGTLMDVFIPHAMKNTSTFDHTQIGANLADFAAIQIVWSLCAWKNSQEDSRLLYLSAAVDALNELCLPIARQGKEHGEGISVDYSISQHNYLHNNRYCSQLYSGSYGFELLSRIFESLRVLNGTFALAPQALQALARVLIDGMGWMGYAQHLDLQVCGRAISRAGSKGFSTYTRWAQALMPFVDERTAEVLTELIRRTAGDESSNAYYHGARLFWVNDYMAYLGPKFSLWAKAVSTRTIGSESGNGESLKGYYMGQGTCLLSRHGQEYDGIQPIWDWQRLPGITAEQDPGFTFPLIEWGRDSWGNHDFAGGVAQGGRGVLSMKWSRGTITNAYKTVLVIDERAICMGSNINSPSARHPVITSINQCRACGPVRYRDFAGKAFVLAPGQSLTSSDIHQVHHDGFLYTFSDWARPSVTVQLKAQTGAWSDINRAGSPDTVTLDVFSLWINHPERENASYLYRVESASELPQTQASTAPLGFVSDVHVSGDGDNVALGTFFKAMPPAAIKAMPYSTAEPIFFPEQACTYIYELQEDHFCLTCADPTQTLEKLSFIVAVDAQGVPQRRIEVALPQGDDKGRAVTGRYPREA
ncbi:polysaccharide lyase family 8 super-sandwich domain-containing protein [Pseudomonas syringae]|nr:silent information regulator protein Sir2 [Pseudomonas syringae]